MTLEADLMAVLLTQCDRVHVGVAPHDTQHPYVTWQHIGGTPLDYVDNTVSETRHAQIQINTWGGAPLQAFALMKDIEAAVRAAPAFVGKPLSEPIGAHDDADVASGYLQTYTIFGNR